MPYFKRSPPFKYFGHNSNRVAKVSPFVSELVYFKTDGFSNSINRVPPVDGEVVTVLGGGNDIIVAGTRSVALSRGPYEARCKYVTTYGGFGPSGTFVEGG
jgi:hypothetical protein